MMTNSNVHLTLAANLRGKHSFGRYTTDVESGQYGNRSQKDEMIFRVKKKLVNHTVELACRK